LEEYKPISLVGSMWKIIAKLLSLWLKGLLDRVINQTLLVFMKGREFLYNVLVANEVIGDVAETRRKA